MDDPAQVCRVEKYQGIIAISRKKIINFEFSFLFTFFKNNSLGPGFDSLNHFTNEKSAYNLKQSYTIVKTILENSLEGFCPRDEKFFKVL